MRTSTAAMGLMGGVGLALALVAPLYVGLPSNYVDNWMYMTTGGGQAGVILAGLLLIGTGFLAGALVPSDAVRAGTTASTLAALLGAVFMLSPGITVEALHRLLEAGPNDDLPDLVADAVRRVMWMPATASLGLLVGGPGLGALGGIAFDLWYAEPTRPVRLVRASPVPLVGLVANTAWGGVLAWLWVAAGAQLAPLGSGPQAIKSVAAPAILGLWTTIFLCWALRDAVVWIRSRSRLRGTLWGLAAIALAALTLTPLAWLSTAATSPAVLAGLAVATLAALASIVIAARGDASYDPEPRRVIDVIVEAILVGGLTVGLGVLTVGPVLASESLLINPTVAELAGDDVPPIDPSAAVQQLFRYHWFSVVAMAGVAFGWSLLRFPFTWMRNSLVR